MENQKKLWKEFERGQRSKMQLERRASSSKQKEDFKTRCKNERNERARKRREEKESKGKQLIDKYLTNDPPVQAPEQLPSALNRLSQARRDAKNR